MLCDLNVIAGKAIENMSAVAIFLFDLPPNSRCIVGEEVSSALPEVLCADVHWQFLVPRGCQGLPGCACSRCRWGSRGGRGIAVQVENHKNRGDTTRTHVPNQGADNSAPRPLHCPAMSPGCLLIGPRWDLQVLGGPIFFVFFFGFFFFFFCFCGS